MTTANLALWSVHVLLAIGAAEGAVRLLRLRSPSVLLALRQSLLAGCLLLPALEPRIPAPAGRAQVTAWTVSRAAAHNPTGERQAPDWTRLLWTALALGAAYRLLRLGAGLTRLRHLRRRATPLEDGYRDLQERLGTRAAICESSDVEGPVTFGWRHPTVLLPPRWVTNRLVVCHELWHVRRRDWLFTCAEQGVAAALWFHPAISWLVAQIQLAREQEVDARVLGEMGDREGYLTTLLHAAAETRLLAASPFLRRRHLRQRITQILEEASMSPLRIFTSTAAAAAAVAFTVWFSIHALPLRAAVPDEPGGATVTIQHIDMSGLPEELQQQVAGELTVRESQSLTMGAIEGAMARIEALDKQVRTFVSENESGLVDVHIFAAGGAQGPSGPVLRIKVGGNVQQQRLISKPVPKYPVEAKQKGIQGVVVLSIVIARDGTVERAQRVSGDPILATAAIDAVRHWVYETTLLNGNPVEVEAQVNVNFTLAP